jgi:hypothetical protein
MKIFDNPFTVADELAATFEEVTKEESGYRHQNLYFFGDQVWKAAQKAYPGVFKPLELTPSNDYSGHRSKSAIFASKNKSRATFDWMYHTEVYSPEDSTQILESTYGRGAEMILCADGRRFHMYFKRSGCSVESIYEVNDQRNYYEHLPYDYDTLNPKPSKTMSALTDDKLDAWIKYITERQNACDEEVKSKYAKVYEFVQKLRDTIDPSKCTICEIGDNKGRIVANNLRLTYNVSRSGYLDTRVDIYRNLYGDNMIDEFVKMTGIESVVKD